MSIIGEALNQWNNTSVMHSCSCGQTVMRQEYEPPLYEQDGTNTCELLPSEYQYLVYLLDGVSAYALMTEPEVKERKITEILRKLKDGVNSIQDSYTFKEFLLTMSKFHDYSLGNIMLIMLQKPIATHVAGYVTWKNLGRYVKSGEHGIAILAPCFPPKVKPEQTEISAAGEEETKEYRPIYFRVVYVFDVSQTEGKPLPDVIVPILTGDVNENLFDKILTSAQQDNVRVSFEPMPEQDPEIKGFYSNRHIWVKPQEPRAQQLKTLLHEYAHYYSKDIFHISRSDAETIAESAAFAVGAHFGFDTGIGSFPYVALWSKEIKTLELNLGYIRRVANSIIDKAEAI